MSRLSNVRPRLDAGRSPITRAPISERERTALRDRSAPWRRWYRTKRWQQLRVEVIAAAEFRCAVTGVRCSGTHPAPDAPTVDHKIPHRGLSELFWDRGNLQLVARVVHDTVKASIEAGGDGLDAKRARAIERGLGLDLSPGSPIRGAIAARVALMRDALRQAGAE